MRAPNPGTADRQRAEQLIIVLRGNPGVNIYQLTALMGWARGWESFTTRTICLARALLLAQNSSEAIYTTRRGVPLPTYSLGSAWVDPTADGDGERTEVVWLLDLNSRLATAAHTARVGAASETVGTSVQLLAQQTADTCGFLGTTVQNLLTAIKARQMATP